jgi:biotin carboxyl carrier protein
MDNNKEGFLNINSSLYKTRLSPKFVNRQKYLPPDFKKILSYIPGVVLEILVTEGMQVKKGQDLVIVDAMKMKNRIKSPSDGQVKTIAVTPGTKVAKGRLLMELE